jgi:hypothetical protein
LNFKSPKGTKFVEELIDAIEAMRRGQPRESDNTQLHIIDPISEIVTPQWYYSQSYRILQDKIVNSYNLDHLDLIYEISKTIPNVDTTVKIGINFEKSFSSWYQSYHFSPKGKWGVHIRRDSLTVAAARFTKEGMLLSVEPIDAVKAAFFYLFNHTIFHHIIENASTLVEILLGNPFKYPTYLSSVYTRVFNSALCIEESLANSYLVSKSDSLSFDRRALMAHLMKQGPGYDDFSKYLDSDFSKGCRLLISQIKSGSIDSSSSDPLEQIIHVSELATSENTNQIPIWIHDKPNPAKDA